MRTRVSSEERAVEGTKNNQKKALQRTGEAQRRTICGSQKKGKGPRWAVPCALTDDYQGVSVSSMGRKANGVFLSVVSQKCVI